MSKTLKIWSILSTAHLGVAALSMVLGIDRLSAIVAGTIYLPLWPVSKLGLPVFQRNQWMLPPTKSAWLGFGRVFLGVRILGHRNLAWSHS